MFDFATATELPNGATILDRSDINGRCHVLAEWGAEYVVWTVDRETGAAFWGHYFNPIGYNGDDGAAEAARECYREKLREAASAA